MFNRISQGLWWDRAWSLIGGCTPVSAACENCWAAKETYMRACHPNEKIRLNAEFLDKPLKTKKPTAWAVWNDLFHPDVPTQFIRKVWWDVMFGSRLSKQHIFLILTKRPERMKQFVQGFMAERLDYAYSLGDTPEGRMFRKHVRKPVSNIWLGVTAENQQTADERIPYLLETPAAVRFISVEPMLGPVDLIRAMDVAIEVDGEIETPAVGPMNNWLNWVICGGESGPNARPMHPDWVRGLRDQCKEARVPFFFKQWGEWFPRDQWEHNPELVLPDDEFAYHNGPGTHVFKDLGDVYPVHRVGKKAAGRLLDGKEYLELPEVKAFLEEKLAGTGISVIS